MKEVINELSTLHRDIDLCLTDMIHARLHNNREEEDLALDKMEKLMCDTLQTISFSISKLKEYDT